MGIKVLAISRQPLASNKLYSILRLGNKYVYYISLEVAILLGFFIKKPNKIATSNKNTKATACRLLKATSINNSLSKSYFLAWRLWLQALYIFNSIYFFQNFVIY